MSKQQDWSDGYGIEDELFDLTLPSSKGRHKITGPGFMDYDVETRIKSKSQKVEITPTGGQQVIDSAMLEYLTTVWWCTHPDGHWTLFDRKTGKAWARDEDHVKRLRPQDRLYLAEELPKRFFPSLFVGEAQEEADRVQEARDRGEDVEPDPTSSPTESTPGSGSKPTSTDGLSTMPSETILSPM